MNHRLSLLRLAGLGAILASASGAPADQPVPKPDAPAAWDPQPMSLPAPGERIVRARMVAERDALVAGQTATLGVVFDIPEGWHLYWNGQSDSGFPIETEWDLPKGFTPGEQAWPAPARHVSPGEILDHVYYSRVTLVSPISVPVDAAPGPVTLKANLKWLVCKDGCIPEDAAVELTLPVVAAGTPTKETPEAKLIAESRARLPVPVPTDAGVEASLSEQKLSVRVKGASALAFYPNHGDFVLALPIEQAVSTSDALDIEVELLEPTSTVSGVLEVTPAGKDAKPVWYQLKLTPKPAAQDGAGKKK
jgi:DsbC/DsbD-like thiol-disulfide interchange protein